MRGIRAPYAMSVEDFGDYAPGLKSRVPIAGIKPWASTRPNLGELDTQEKIAVAGAAAAGVWWLFATDSDGMSKEQAEARRKSQTGSPTDRPGQKLPGAPDYVKIFQGQKIDALRKFGEGPLVASANNKATPFTTRAFAYSVVMEYWAKEISRLLGLDGRTGMQFDAPFFKPISIGDTSDHKPPGSHPLYHGMVTHDSADAIIKGWNRISKKLRAAIFGGLSFSESLPSALNKNMDPQRAADFWDGVSELAIMVDVDRAIPDDAGWAWVAIRDSVMELPATLSRAAGKILSEVGGFGLRAILGVVKGVLFSPVGLAAGVGLAGYMVYRRRMLRGIRLSGAFNQRKKRRRKRR